MASTETKKSRQKPSRAGGKLNLSQRDLAFEVLRRSIVLGDTKSGTRINERLVAEKLGISRVPVREAMLCLHGEGLLSKSKCGLEVTRLSPEDAEHQLEFRVIVECAAVRLASRRLSDEDAEQLQEELSRQSALVHEQDWRALHESDLRFHQLLLKATNNPFLNRLTGTIALGLLYTGLENESTSVVEEHRAILEAVIQGDEDEASHLMHLHVVGTSEVDADASDLLTDIELDLDAEDSD